MQDLVGNRDLADVVEHRRPLQLVELDVIETEHEADLAGQRRHIVHVAVEVGLPLVERLQEHLLGTVPASSASRASERRAAHQPAQRLGSIIGVLGRMHGSERAGHVEPLTVLA